MSESNPIMSLPSVDDLALAEPDKLSTVATVARSRSGPGADLAAEREALGWTTEQVANQLNLAPRQIQALEADNFAALPGMASVRGFIRSYAKLLKIDVEPLLAQIASPATSPLPEPVSMRRALSAPFFDDSRMSAMGMQGPSEKSNLILPGLILLLVAGLFGGYQMGWLPQLSKLLVRPADKDMLAAPGAAASLTPLEEVKKSDPVPAIAEVAAIAVAATPATLVVSPVSTPVATPALPLTSLQSTAQTSLQTTPSTTAPVIVPSKVAEAAPAVPAAAVAPANRAALVLKFREDSWIDLRRTEGPSANNVVQAYVAKAGTSASFDVAEALALTIGNAKGVDVSLRGAPLDVKTNAKNNVVRLTLK